LEHAMTDDTDNSFARYEEQEKRRRALAAELREATKAKLFDVLHAADIDRVTVMFDGEGDSGQIEETVAFDANSKPRKIPARKLTVQTTKSDGTGPEESTLPVTEVIEQLCYELLEDNYDGWEINEGAHGEFAFDIPDRTLQLTINYRFTDVDTATHTF
jgi:hypothetical protein